MTRLIRNLEEIEPEFDIAVLDQYGVLHNGKTPYPGALEALRFLAKSGKEIAVLSNSGKRSGVNRRRIEAIGGPLPENAVVETSGEAAWNDLNSGAAVLTGDPPHRLLPVAAHPGDAELWAKGNNRVRLTERIEAADGILLMGVPPGGAAGPVQGLFEEALKAGIPVICTNPDRTSPEGGVFVVSPGALADQYEMSGGRVIWYGKPHGLVFGSVRRRFPDTPRNRFLMVGDAMLHDVSGAAKEGFQTCFVRSGIHALNFTKATSETEILGEISRICSDSDLPVPDYSLPRLA